MLQQLKQQIASTSHSLAANHILQVRMQHSGHKLSQPQTYFLRFWIGLLKSAFSLVKIVLFNSCCQLCNITYVTHLQADKGNQDWVNESADSYIVLTTLHTSQHSTSFLRRFFPANHLHWYWQLKTNEKTHQNKHKQKAQNKLALGKKKTCKNTQELFISECLWLCTIVHNTALNSSFLILQSPHLRKQYLQKGRRNSITNQVSKITVDRTCPKHCCTFTPFDADTVLACVMPDRLV